MLCVFVFGCMPLMVCCLSFVVCCWLFVVVSRCLWLVVGGLRLGCLFVVLGCLLAGCVLHVV